MPISTDNPTSDIALPQMQYLELIRFYPGSGFTTGGASAKSGSFDTLWQKFSGGSVQFAMAKHKPAGRRNSIPVPGRYEIDDITLERTYVPALNSLENWWAWIIAAAQNPGNTKYRFTLWRKMYSGPKGTGHGTGVNAPLITKVKYTGCHVVSFNLGDGDVTADEGMTTQQVRIATENVEYGGANTEDNTIGTDVYTDLGNWSGLKM